MRRTVGSNSFSSAGDARGLILAASHWRQQPASEKQRAFLEKQGLPPHLLATLTKGEAQSAIARVLGR